MNITANQRRSRFEQNTPLERVDVLQHDLSPRRVADVRDHVEGFDRVALQEGGQQALGRGERVVKRPQAAPVVEAQPPAVAVDVGVAAATGESAEGEREVRQGRAVHAQELAHAQWRPALPAGGSWPSADGDAARAFGRVRRSRGSKGKRDGSMKEDDRYSH